MKNKIFWVISIVFLLTGFWVTIAHADSNKDNNNHITNPIALKNQERRLQKQALKHNNGNKNKSNDDEDEIEDDENDVHASPSINPSASPSPIVTALPSSIPSATPSVSVEPLSHINSQGTPKIADLLTQLIAYLKQVMAKK